jgi:hypothetical protein
MNLNFKTWGKSVMIVVHLITMALLIACFILIIKQQKQINRLTTTVQFVYGTVDDSNTKIDDIEQKVEDLDTKLDDINSYSN